MFCLVDENEDNQISISEMSDEISQVCSIQQNTNQSMMESEGYFKKGDSKILSNPY